MKVYQVPNLLEEYFGTVNTTFDTSTARSTDETAENLFFALDNRTCANSIQPLLNADADEALYKSCFLSENA